MPSRIPTACLRPPPTRSWKSAFRAWAAGRKGRRLAKADLGLKAVSSLSPQQRLLILDTWRRSGLPAGDFADLVGLSKHTLYAWKKKFEEQGPAGLMTSPRLQGQPPERSARTLHPDAQAGPPRLGLPAISDVLLRGPGLSASPTSVAKMLHDEGYELVEQPTQPHPDKVRRDSSGPRPINSGRRTCSPSC